MLFCATVKSGVRLGYSPAPTEPGNRVAAGHGDGLGLAQSKGKSVSGGASVDGIIRCEARMPAFEMLTTAFPSIPNLMQESGFLYAK